MAAITGLPQPKNLPYTETALSTYDVPSYLGVFVGQGSTSTWNLPELIGDIVTGVQTIVLNAGSGTITLVAAAGNTISGNPTLEVAAGESAQLITSLGTWRVIASAGGVAPPAPAGLAPAQTSAEADVAQLSWAGAVTYGATITIVQLGPPTFDGIALQIGMRVLLWLQANPSQNGTYVVSALAPVVLQRADTVYASGDTITVYSGQSYGNAQYILSTPPPITVGTSPLIFTRVSGIADPSSTLFGHASSGTGSAYGAYAQATNGTAIGELALANSGTALGTSSSANGGTALGASAVSSAGSTAVGAAANASNDSTALGTNSSAQQTGTALGQGANATSGVALGASAQTSGGTALGDGASAQSGGTAGGTLAQAGTNSTSYGTRAGGTTGTAYGYEAGLGASGGTWTGNSAGAGATGDDLCGYGDAAGRNSSGSRSSYYGNSSGENASGDSNAGYGHRALAGASCTMSSYFGAGAGEGTTGDWSSGLGAGAGAGATGNINLFLGAGAGANSSGSYCVYGGLNTGQNQTGSYHLLLGQHTSTALQDFIIQLGAGTLAYANLSSQIGANNTATGADGDILEHAYQFGDANSVTGLSGYTSQYGVANSNSNGMHVYQFGENMLTSQINYYIGAGTSNSAASGSEYVSQYGHNNVHSVAAQYAVQVGNNTSAAATSYQFGSCTAAAADNIVLQAGICSIGTSNTAAQYGSCSAASGTNLAQYGACTTGAAIRAAQYGVCSATAPTDTYQFGACTTGTSLRLLQAGSITSGDVTDGIALGTLTFNGTLNVATALNSSIGAGTQRCLAYGSNLAIADNAADIYLFGNAATCTAASDAISFGNAASCTAVGGMAFGHRSRAFGTESTSFGYEVYRLTSGTARSSTGFGYRVGYNTTTATQSCAFGNNALYYNTSGINNSAFGCNALGTNPLSTQAPAAYNNCAAFGQNSMLFHSTGDFCASFGTSALRGSNPNMITGQNTNNSDTAMGNECMNWCHASSFNSAYGRDALKYGGSPINNTCSGFQALFCPIGTITTNAPVGNAAYGWSCMMPMGAAATLSNNSAFGTQAMNNCGPAITGTSAFGYQCLSVVIGNNNSGYGSQALRNCTTGTDHTAFGNGAATDVQTGSGTTVLGAGAQAGSSSAVDRIVLGRGVSGQTNSQLVAGAGASLWLSAQAGGVAALGGGAQAGFHSQNPVNVKSVAGPITLTPADFGSGALLTVTASNPGEVWTTPSGADLAAKLAGANGQSYMWYTRNETANDIAIAAGAGITLVSASPMAANTSVIWKITQTAAAAYRLERFGSLAL